MSLAIDLELKRVLEARAITPAGDRALTAYRIVSASLLISLLWKLQAFRWMLDVYQALPLYDDFFPRLLQTNVTLVAAYIAAVVMSFWGLVGRSRALLHFQSLTLSLALAVLCIHQGSYNDVTFCTCLWASLWCLWYVSRIEQDPLEPLSRKASTLGLLIIALIIFGGAVGKLTPGYWSGAVLYDIYFLDRDFWLFNLLRQNLSEVELRSVSMWYSRFVMIAELTAPILIALLPRRPAAIIAIATLCGIGIFSNWMLFSVLFCLIGLATISFLTPNSPRSTPAPVYSGV